QKIFSAHHVFFDLLASSGHSARQRGQMSLCSCCARPKILILKLACKTRATCSLTLLRVSVSITVGLRSGFLSDVVVSRLGMDLMDRGSAQHLHWLSWFGPEIKPFEESCSSP